MTDRELIDRIHEDLDGNLTPVEHEELLAQLSGNPVAGRCYQQWKKIRSDLQQDAEIPGGVDLKQPILDQIESLPEPFRQHKPGIINLFRYRPALRYAALFVLGLCAGSLLTFLVFSWNEVPDTSSSLLSGTLADKVAGQVSGIDEFSFADAEISSDFRFTAYAHHLKADVTLSAHSAATIVITYDPGAIQVANINYSQTYDPPGVVLSPGTIEIRCEGDNALEILLKSQSGTPGNIGIDIFRNDLRIFNRIINSFNKL